MAAEISEERRELGRSLDRLFEVSGRSRQEWADALGVTRGAVWQWSDCRTVPRAEVWLKLIEDAADVGAPDEAMADLLAALDVPLGKLGVKQPSRVDCTLLDEIVARACKDLGTHLATLPFRDALGVLHGAMSHAHRREREGEWETNLVQQFEHVLGPVVDTVLGPENGEVDRARLGAAAWRVTYDWAVARPEETINEGKVTRVVNDAVRGLVVEWGGSLRIPSY